MGSSAQQKDERINLRLKHSAKQTLERAASFEGQTVSKFVLASALAQAEKTIREHDQISLGVRESEAFYDALSRPVKFNATLMEGFAEHKKRVKQR